jgi:hypothetical protein
MERDAVQCGRQEKPVTSIFCEHSYDISSYLTSPARSIYIVFRASLTTLTKERKKERKKKQK